MAGRAELEAMQLFVNSRNLEGFPHVVDESGDIWASFDVRSQPAWVFIDDDGTVTSVNGAIGADELNERIEALLAT